MVHDLALDGNLDLADVEEPENPDIIIHTEPHEPPHDDRAPDDRS
jgi:hypothetical protein